MKFVEEPVQPSKFKKALDVKEVKDLHTALNVLRLYYEWRKGQCNMELDSIGLTPAIISQAELYILGKFRANKQLYKCTECVHGNWMPCVECTFEKDPDAEEN